MIKGFVLRKENFGGLLANLKTGKIYKLDQNGYNILLLLKDGDSVDKLLKKIKQKYSFDLSTEKEIISFIKNLKKEKIINC